MTKKEVKKFFKKEEGPVWVHLKLKLTKRWNTSCHSLTCNVSLEDIGYGEIAIIANIFEVEVVVYPHEIKSIIKVDPSAW